MEYAVLVEDARYLNMDLNKYSRSSSLQIQRLVDGSEADDNTMIQYVQQFNRSISQEPQKFHEDSNIRRHWQEMGMPEKKGLLLWTLFCKAKAKIQTKRKAVEFPPVPMMWEKGDGPEGFWMDARADYQHLKAKYGPEKAQAFLPLFLEDGLKYGGLRDVLKNHRTVTREALHREIIARLNKVDVSEGEDAYEGEDEKSEEDKQKEIGDYHEYDEEEIEKKSGEDNQVIVINRDDDESEPEEESEVDMNFYGPAAPNYILGFEYEDVETIGEDEDNQMDMDGWEKWMGR